MIVQRHLVGVERYRLDAEFLAERILVAAVLTDRHPALQVRQRESGGAVAAGVEVARIEVDKEGRIVIIAGKPTESANVNALDAWMAKNARAA